MFENNKSIPNWFSGKNIFITGGTGFIGKVLIEKLLRSCPKLKNIYIIVRSKKGLSPVERVKTITDGPLFDVLRESNPNFLDKIIPMEGDMAELRLGLSEENWSLLCNNINIIYHCAASVRFDDPLHDAILVNTRSTREVVEMAKSIRKLDALIHVSTTYCNTDRPVIDEVVYPPHANWQDTIKLVEETDPQVLQVLTEKYIDPLPNTYTFAKSLAEHVIKDSCENIIPTVIMRPSIVISTLREPIKGWTDNFNGPVGLLVGAGKGILFSTYTDPNLTLDFLPVDVLVRGLIIVAWKKGCIEPAEERNKVKVYNCSNNNVNNITVNQLRIIGLKLTSEVPLNNILWYPSQSMTQCKYNYYLMVLLYHILPALLVDGILKLAGNSFRLLRVQRKIFIANMALRHFMINEWKFLNQNALELEKDLEPEDIQNFSPLVDSFIEPYSFFREAILGGREYLLKEKKSTIPQAKIHMNRMLILRKLVLCLRALFVMWLLLYKINIIKLVYTGVMNYCEYLQTPL